MSRGGDNQSVLDAIMGRRPNIKNIVRANCPFCIDVVNKVDRKQCLSVSVASGFWKCYRCGSDGRIAAEELPFSVSTVQAPPAQEARPAVDLPEGFIALYGPDGQSSLCAAALKYLAKHRVGITEQVLKEAKIGACVRGEFNGRVVVPIHKGGKLVGFVGRVWQKKPPPGVLVYRYSRGFERSTTLYNESALYVRTDKPVLIVEGVFDTYPFWPDACAVLGKPSPAQVEMMLNANRPLLIVFDGDAHREATSLAMALRMRGKTAAALRLPPGFDPDQLHKFVLERAAAAFRAA